MTSISDDDVQVMNEDGTPKTRTGDDGTVYYYRNVRTQAAMVTLDYDGNVLPWWAVWAKRPRASL